MSRRTPEHFPFALIAFILFTLVVAAGSAAADIPASPALDDDLTGRTWVRSPGADPSLGPESETWEFYPTRIFRRTIRSDVARIHVGTWSMTPGAGQSGVMFLVSPADRSGSFPNRHVLSFAITKDRLRLGERWYGATAPPDGAGATGDGARDRPAGEDAPPERLFPLWSKVIRNEWSLAAAPSPAAPDRLVLARDGTFHAHHRSRDCRYEGTWSLSFSGESSGTLVMSVPAHDCDQRGSTGETVREAPVSVERGILRIGGSEYTTSEERDTHPESQSQSGWEPE